ncbi:MAG: hypothetical protein K0U72_00150 [Gammaproteobacteria bacterium]|nr:hypothetical protein [Gammaproteobacteria bacterium]
MNTSYDKNTAVVVLPPVRNGRLQNAGLRAWLARSDLTCEPEPVELLARVCGELGQPYPEQGFAALRMWGQTSDRPTNWISAADPVYLEPRLDHLCLHALRRVGVKPKDMRALIDHLQDTLSAGGEFGFARLGSYSYVSAQQPFATASVPAYVVDQQVPNDYLPSGDGADRHRNLQSEIEMALHDHDVNQARVGRGEQPVNSLWLWGAGVAPQQTTRAQPPLFSDDALLTGYWYSGTGVAEPWLGNIAACLDESVAGFIAETPEFDNDPGLLERCLLELRAALRSKRLNRLILLFRDGVRADVVRSQALRVWRRDDALLAEVKSQ